MSTISRSGSNGPASCSPIARSCPLLVVVAVTFPSPLAGPARPQWQPQGNGLSSLLHRWVRSPSIIAGADLYDMKAQKATLAAQRVPDAAGIRYLPSIRRRFSICLPLLRACPTEGVSCGGFHAQFMAFCCYKKAFGAVCPNLSEHWGFGALLASCLSSFFFTLYFVGTKPLPSPAVFHVLAFFLRGSPRVSGGIALGCLIFIGLHWDGLRASSLDWRMEISLSLGQPSCFRALAAGFSTIRQ